MVWLFAREMVKHIFLLLVFKLTAQNNKGAVLSVKQFLTVMYAFTAGDSTVKGSGCFPRLLVM